MARTLEEAIQHQIEWNESQHYLNSPKHGDAALVVLIGILESLHHDLPDDPALAAYQIRDTMPKAYGYVKDLWKWANAVIRTYPDDVPPKGARICR